jgi:hypothetical protein
MNQNVVPLRPAIPAPTAEQLQIRIRQLAEAGAMRWEEPHFQKRLLQRKLTMRHVLETVKKGDPVGAPSLDQWGDWRLKLKRKVAGRRVQVVVAMKSDHFVYVTAI